jgi:DNA ligase 1
MALPPSGDEGEEDMENDSDDELQSTKQVASKRLVYNIYHDPMSSDMCLPSAKAALLRKNDVDVKGGWKVGNPFVFLGQKH